MHFMINLGVLFIHGAILTDHLTSAFVEVDQKGTVAEKSFKDDDLKNAGNTEYRGPNDLPDSAKAKVSALEDKLGLPKGTTKVDARSGRVTSISPSKPIFPGKGTGNNLLWNVGIFGNGGHAAPKNAKEWENAGVHAFKSWLLDHEADLDIDASGEVFPLGGIVRSGVHDDGDLIQIYIPRTFQGIPVVGSNVAASIKDGNLISVGIEQWGSIPNNFSVEPRLTAEDAMAAIEKHVGHSLSGDEWCKPELKILTMALGAVPSKPGNIRNTGSTFGNAYKYKLVYQVCPKFDGQGTEQMMGYVDAQTGKVYSCEDMVDYFDAKGSVYPTSNDKKPPDGLVQPGWPMPWMYVGSQTTDTGGNFAVGGSQTARFDGPYVNMADNCGTESLTQTDGIDWGNSDGTDCTTPGFGGAGNTHASRSGFYELNKMKEMARSHLPNNTWLKAKLTANMNIVNSCNAFWNGSTVNFYRSGGGCANTGEIAAIFDHEWGHGMDDNDVVGGISMPSGEGIADLYSALRLNDSCIGRGFKPGVNCNGNGNACTDCTGVRDIDYLKRQSGNPTTYTWANANCGGSVHCLGYVYSEAVWSLYKRKLQSPPYNYDNNRALEVVTRLTYIAAGSVTTWYSGGPPYGGCGANSGYKQFLAADDDNGNINDGTPHMEAIYHAFNDQEIACQTPTVQDSGCPNLPNIAPTVTANSGNNNVVLTWNAVPNASTYQVFRTEGVFGCDQGKVKVGETSGLTFTESGLQNYRQYYYVVIPKSRPQCFGPASTCMTAIPNTGPDFSFTCDESSILFSLDTPGSSVQRQCTVNADFGFTGTINSITCYSSSLTGISCTPSASSVTIVSGQTSAPLTITIGMLGNAGVSSGNVTLSATYGSTTMTSQIPITVVASVPEHAVYDASYGAPRCSQGKSECTSGDLLNGRGNVGPEANTPNNIDTCTDGVSGFYLRDESLEKIVIRSGDIAETAASGFGGPLTPGGTATIIATVWAFGTGENDSADFYYASDASNPSWQYLTTLVPPGGGAQELKAQYTIPQAGSENQAVRVSFRFKGSQSSCPNGSYDDADDLVFRVLDGTLSPTKSPTTSPTAPSVSPTPAPTNNPTKKPTSKPTFSPTTAPPTRRPTSRPTIGCGAITSGRACRDTAGCSWSGGRCN